MTSENLTARFHEQLGGDALLSVLSEAQDTVRSYDNKAQFMGAGLGPVRLLRSVL